METSKEIKDFLTTRRARITPDMVGLPAGGRRRVPGLRREEVALLAGVSSDYYVQIERGTAAGVSDEVLHAIASALRLDDDETAHLIALARATAPKHRRRTVSHAGRVESLSEPMQTLLDAMVTAPAVVMNGRLDIVGANALGRALYADVLGRGSGSPNVARFVFLDHRAQRMFPAWNIAADDAVAMLHVEAARVPDSPDLTELVGELATRSAEFRTRWAAHRITAHRRGVKHFHHPAVGELALRFERLDLADSRGLALFGFTAEPGSPSEERLRLLASWLATDDPQRQHI